MQLALIGLRYLVDSGRYEEREGDSYILLGKLESEFLKYAVIKVRAVSWVSDVWHVLALLHVAFAYREFAAFINNCHPVLVL